MTPSREQYPGELIQLRTELARWRTELLPFLAHGSHEHQAWLGTAIEAFANKEEAPPLVPDGAPE